MVLFPHCKINLGLHVLSKRLDGYHEIETCFYPVPRFDVLEAIKSDSFSFDQTGFFIPGNESDNLCIKAYRLLKNEFDIGDVKIHLHKIIPLGAGLGGGSSDAAFMLKLLSDLFNLNLNFEQLGEYASMLGSDCAFFTQDKPMIGRGRGEILEDVDLSLKDYWIGMVKPEIHISTAEAYAGVSPNSPKNSLLDILKSPLETWQNKLQNDFEKSIFKKHPLLYELKEKFYSHGAIYSAMSGSGSTLFGIFEKQPSFQKQFEGMDYWEGELK